MAYHNQVVKDLTEKIQDEMYIWLIDELLSIELENKNSDKSTPPKQESTQWQRWELEQNGL